MAEQTLIEKLEDYAFKIHLRWLNARDMELTTTGVSKTRWGGLRDALYQVELDLRKIINLEELSHNIAY